MDLQPKISDDGKFYWDGQRWQPLASQSPLTIEHSTKMPGQRLPGWAIVTIGVVMLFGLLFWIGAASS
ncbi:hypothetical protein GCM10009798_27020 [Nocardioides panacihumi]|uniref:DUF2510 domain-containing protein n=1 Tax=Nocardioides panacihumi TaxID=400774 RepID=A0ABN2R8V1_9ACTN